MSQFEDANICNFSNSKSELFKNFITFFHLFSKLFKIIAIHRKIVHACLVLIVIVVVINKA